MENKFLAFISNFLIKYAKTTLARVILGFILISPIIFLSVYNFSKIYSEATEIVFVQKISNVKLSSAIIKSKLDSVVDLGISMATRPRVVEGVAKKDWIGAIHVMDGFMDSFPFIEWLYISDTDGIIRSDMPTLPGVAGTSMADQDWYKGVAKDWKPYVSNVYKRVLEPRHNIIAVAVPVKSTGRELSDQNELIEKNKILGILIMQIKIDKISDWCCKGIDLGQGAIIYIVDKKGNLVFHPLFDLEGEIRSFSEVDIVKEVLAGKSNYKFNYNSVEKEWRVAAYEPVDGYGWGVVLTQPGKFAFLERNRKLLISCIVYAIAIFLSFFSYYMILGFLDYRRKAEEELIKTMNMKSNFTSAVSHDLRTPLGPIKEGVDMVLDGFAGPINDGQKQLLAIVKSNANRLEHLVNSILEFQKLGSKGIKFDMEDNNINEVIQETKKDMVIVALKKGLKIDLDLNNDIPIIKFDKEKIANVLINLISNAIKFTDSGMIKITTRKTGDFVQVSVSDTGMGIDKDDIPKLFHSYSRLDSPIAKHTEGSGLGLAICKEIVEEHKGRIWVESEAGKGSIFQFTLPINS